jgi:hypothetical protein
MLRWWRGEDSAELRSGLLVMALVCGVTLWKGFAAGVALGMLLSMAIFIARMNRSLLRSRLRRRRSARRGASTRPPVEERCCSRCAAPSRCGSSKARSSSAMPTAWSALADSPAGRRARAGAGPAPRHSIDETGAVSLALLGQNCGSAMPVLVLLAGLADGSAPDRALLAHG